MYDETIRQVTQRGERLADALAHVGIMPGKVVTGDVLERVFRALSRQRVALEGMLLKPNMVVPGKECPEQVSVPAAVPGIVFRSGGQDERSATAHLNAMNSGPESRPWRVSFSYGRALQDPALEAWGGRAAGVQAGQQALHHRARCNSAASLGEYDDSMERDTADVAMASQRAHWSDD
jgi:fructose-bisphosphate aldolase, class I